MTDLFMSEITDGITDSLVNMAREIGMLIAVVVLLAAGIFLLPCIVALLRGTASRLPVVIANFAIIALIPLSPILTVVAWLILAGVAIGGRKKIQPMEIPNIVIRTTAPRSDGDRGNR
jgi:hypothetical protein